MEQIVPQDNDEAAATPVQKAREALGDERLAELCGRGRPAICKWARPLAGGGGGGLLPAQFQARVLKASEEDGLGLTAEDLIAEPRA